MLRAFTLLLSFVTLVLAGCSRIEADAAPYLDGVFVGQYRTAEGAAPVSMTLELTASATGQKRYTITGRATIGATNFTAEGYELASNNLDYLAPQAYPPPNGTPFVAFQNEEGLTVCTLCTSIYYREHDSDTPRVASMILIESAPQDELNPAYCASSYRYENFATVELTKREN